MGTFINALAIISGAGFGVLAGHKLSMRTRSLITDVLGLITLLAGGAALAPFFSERYSSALPDGWSLLLILAALLVGGITGSLLRIESRLDSFGIYLRTRFNADKEGPFLEGFITASLLFVIGPLAILGSLSDGMSNGIDQLLLKSSLDFFAAMAFAATLGWGVAAAAIPVLIYQGVWTFIGLSLGEILSDYQIDAMTIVGGLMLVCIALRLLKIKEVAVGNLLPSLLFAPIFALALHSLI